MRRGPVIRSVLAALTLLPALGGCGGVTATAVPGLTSRPCPAAVNEDNGCIYLGTVSDLTAGPFTPLAVRFTAAQRAFWQRVNEQGGIGGYDVDVTTYVRDNKYDPELHARAYQEIKGKVLALAQTLGTETTRAILPDLRANKILAVPASFTSAWNFEDVILNSGANYCFDAMNAIDYATAKYDLKSVLAVHYAGDYGGDAAAGVKVAAARNKLRFTRLETPAGTDRQRRAVDAIVKARPGLVHISTSPGDAAEIVGQAVARGFEGRFIGSGPSWDKALLKSPAAPALKARYEQVTTFKPFHTDSPGHQAMRKALGSVDPSDSHTSGWVLSYPLKAVLEKAAANGDLTRTGLYTAVKQLTSVDYEGILPPGAGNYSGDPDVTALRKSAINAVDAAKLTGVVVVKEPFAGPTVLAHTFTAPCYDTL